jgi:serine protease Do
MNVRKINVIVGMGMVMAALLLGPVPQATFAAPDPVVMVPVNFTELAEKAKPSVVNIRTVRTVKGGGRVFEHFFGSPFEDNNPFSDPRLPPFFRNQPSPDYKQRSLGSGFIMDTDGYIVTNNHVVEDADQIKVKLVDGEEYDATVVGRDPNTDLALIKITADIQLKALPLGDSEKLKVGSWVTAIGSPFGLEQTVTAGIVSAKGRIIGSGPYDDFIQTDASINPGNSGGPLINMDGEVVGINTAIIAQGQGIGFAIPINLAKGIIDQLKESGEVTRGWLGVGIQELTPELAEYYGIKAKKGVLVTQVYEGDPADKAGIVPKDVILSVEGKPVATPKDLSMEIANLPVGKKIKVQLIRDGKPKTVSVTLGKRKDGDVLAGGEKETTRSFGLTTKTLTPEMARQLGLSENESGILITAVEPGGKADNAGLKRGDLIIEVNRKGVGTDEEFQKEINDLKPGNAVKLLVKRGNYGFFLANLEK